MRPVLEFILAGFPEYKQAGHIEPLPVIRGEPVF
jgi:hypothetical protein